MTTEVNKLIRVSEDVRSELNTLKKRKDKKSLNEVIISLLFSNSLLDKLEEHVKDQLISEEGLAIAE